MTDKEVQISIFKEENSKILSPNQPTKQNQQNGGKSKEDGSNV